MRDAILSQFTGHVDLSPEAVELRRQWIFEGKQGHYPTCSCSRCVWRTSNDESLIVNRSSESNGPLTEPAP